MKCFYAAAVLVLSIGAANAQSFSFGIKGGVNATDVWESGDLVHAASHLYTIGPTAELRLPFGFGLEADALYRRTGVNGATPSLVGLPFTSYHGAGNTWDIPIVLKYRMGALFLHPYVEGGYAARHVSNNFDTVTLTPLPTLTTTKGTVSTPFWNNGVVLGVGVELKALVIRVSPEFRYTRWTDANPLKNPAGVLFTPGSNQAEFLLGVSF